MTSTSTVNYKDSYFDHPVLTKICREPTYETLHHLKNQIKANASSVPTTLGDGNIGYLVMVLTPTEYHCIAPANTFIQPLNTGVLVPNPAGTAAQIASTEYMHRLTKEFYLNTLLLERTIIKKIIKAVDTKYLAALHNAVTGKSRHSSQTSLIYYTNYGRITPQQLDNKTTIVKPITYNPSQPIDLVFNSIDDLVEYTISDEAE